MKSILIILIAIVNAKLINDFYAKDDYIHTKCSMEATLEGISCEKARDQALDLIAANDRNSVFKGLTKVVNLNKDYIISSKKNWHHIWKDELLFEFESLGNDCKIKSRGRAWLTGNHFCNMWNVVSRLDGFLFFESDCENASDNPTAHCKSYLESDLKWRMLEFRDKGTTSKFQFKHTTWPCDLTYVKSTC